MWIEFQNPLNESELVFPILECFHILGFAVTIGTIALVDFRLLGFGLRAQSAPDLSKSMAPWSLFGLVSIFLLVPVLYLIHRRWSVLGGMTAGGVVLAGLCFVAGGIDWLPAYLRVLMLPDINPARWFMPNIHGLVPSGPAEWLAMAVTAAAGIFVMMRTDYLTGFAMALTGSLLLSYHAYFQDALLLIPVILIVLNDSRKLLRNAAMLLATPVPWVLMLVLRKPVGG